MSRKLFLGVLGGMAAGTVLAAGSDAVSQLMNSPIIFSAGFRMPQPDGLAMLLSTLSLMTAIAVRRSR